MKNASIFSTVLLILSALFLTQTAQAQLNQNSITKSITTNSEFNGKPNAVFGIGATTGFNAKLDVQGAYGNTVASFRKSATGKGVAIVSDWPGVYFNAYHNGGGKSMAAGYAGIVNFDPDFGRFDFGITSTAATGSNAVLNLTALMSINKDGNVGIGTGSPVSKLDIIGQDGLRITGYQPFITLLDNNSNRPARIQTANGDIIFHKGLGNTYTQQLVIKENGNVGIGTSTPVSKLDVIGQDGLRVTGYQPFITLLDNNSNRPARIQTANGDIIFHKGSGNAYTQQLVIKENGNVGIGTSTPVSKLDVIGQDGLRTTGYQPFITLLDNNSNRSTRMQSANGDFILHRAVGTANYSTQLIVKDNGNVLIGTVTDSGYKLAVNGNIRAKEIRVQTGWADYVFADDYRLRPLEEVETFIKANRHLPEIQPASEIQENGLDLAATTTKMMSKIEELTLYLIDMKKENDALKARVNLLEKQ